MAAVTRSIQGVINADGTIRSGEGFTVTHDYIGVYIIRFLKPFDSTTFSGYTVKVKPDLEEGGKSKKKTVQAANLSRGDNAWVILGNEEGMKYFTFEVKPNELEMKDIAVEFFAYGLDNEEAAGSLKNVSSDQLPTFRTITGIVDANGNRVAGEGFTLSPHTHVGSYLVKFDKPFEIIQDGSFSVQVIQEESAKNPSDPTIQTVFVPLGANAAVVEGTRTQMKYFTFEVRTDGLIMKDLSAEFSAQGMDF